MPFQAEHVFQDLVLHGLMASQDYVALARCIFVCKRWRQALTQFPIAFIDALPAVMDTFHERIYTVTPDTPPTEVFVGELVTNVVKGLQDHLHYRPAVEAIIAKSHTILALMLVRQIHPGTLSRPSLWLLLVALKVYRGDADMGLEVLRLITTYQIYDRALQINTFTTYDPVETVVLSDEQQVVAARIVDDFEASHRHTARYMQDFMGRCQKVREWIAERTMRAMQ